MVLCKTYQCYGVPFALLAGDQTLADALFEALPPNSVQCDLPPAFRCSLELRDDCFCALGCQPDERWELPELLPVLEHLRGSLEFAVACHSEEYIFVHASACQIEGRGLVFPGRSYAGKTTLVMALMGRGAVFYSDEFAVIDRLGRLHPFVRPLSIRREGCEMGEKVSARSLGYALGNGPTPVGLIADLAHGPKWRTEELSPGAATLALFNNTVAARRYPLRAMESLMAASAGALALQGTRGEATQAALELIRRLELGVEPAAIPVAPFHAMEDLDPPDGTSPN